MTITPDKLCVLFITPFFVPVIGGVETVVYETSLGLVERGHQAVVLTSRIKNQPARESTGGVEVIRTELLEVPEDGIVDPRAFDLCAVADLVKGIIDEMGVDIVHLHNYQMKQYAMFLFGVLKAIDTRKIPVFITIHNTTEDPFAHYLFSYLPFSRVVALTTKSAFDLIKGGVPPEKVTVIPNMIDTEKFMAADGAIIRNALKVDKEPIILFPSRLVGRERNTFGQEEGKGLHVLIRALPLIRREIPDIKLLLMGNDPVYSDCIRQVRKHTMQALSTMQCRDTLLFLNEDLPQEQLPNVFAASDVVVSLGPTECFGIVFLEGMAAGKPVIGANSWDNSVSEVIRDGRSGALVPPNDPWHTAEAIIRFLTDRELARAVGKEAMRWVQEMYDVRVVLPRLLETYMRALQEKRVSPVAEGRYRASSKIGIDKGGRVL